MKEDNLVKIKDFQEYQQVWQSEVSLGEKNENWHLGVSPDGNDENEFNWQQKVSPDEKIKMSLTDDRE